MLKESRILVFMIAITLSIPAIASAISPNVDVIPTPTSFSLNVNISQAYGTNFTLFNNMTNTSVSNVFMNATFLQAFNPINMSIQPNSSINFTASISIPLNITNITQTFKDNITVFGDLKNLTDNSTISSNTLIAFLPLELNITNVTMENYYYKECFIENNQEYCTLVNMSNIIQVNVINETQNITTFNVLMPFNITKEMLQNNTENNQNILNRMDEIVSSVKNASQATIDVAQREKDSYRNALTLEIYLKNPTNPTWTQISPFNTLVNATGFSGTEFDDALNILFQFGKITQKTVKQTVTVPTATGSLTQGMDVFYIASADRVNSESIEHQSSHTTTAAIVISLLIVGSILVWEFVLKKRIKL